MLRGVVGKEDTIRRVGNDALDRLLRCAIAFKEPVFRQGVIGDFGNDGRIRWRNNRAAIDLGGLAPGVVSTGPKQEQCCK